MGGLSGRSISLISMPKKPVWPICLLLLVICSAIIRVDGTFPQLVSLMSLCCFRPLFKLIWVFDIDI